jgi:hypothetical protein
VNGLTPKGTGQRLIEALAVLWLISFVAHQVTIWLTPVVPLIIAVAVLVTAWVLVFGRRRR